MRTWQGKTTTLHVHHAFLYIYFPSLHDYHVKMPNFTFCGGRKQPMSDKIYFLLMNLDMVNRNSAPQEFARIWQSKRVGIITIETEKMWIHFSCDVFMGVSCRGILNSLIFTKTWSMQAWIPVVSSSLYFQKSAFSFRVDSILKWRVYIKLKVSCLRAFLWCMSQTSRDRPDSRHVRTHRNNSGDVVRRLGTIIQSIFLCSISSQYSLDSLEMVRWESAPRGFSSWAWKLSSPLFSRPDWPPLGLRAEMDSNVLINHFLGMMFVCYRLSPFAE